MLNSDFYLGNKVKPNFYKELNISISSSGQLQPIHSLGSNGTIDTVAKYAEDISWRETSKPFGIIAAKRVGYSCNAL